MNQTKDWQYVQNNFIFVHVNWSRLIVNSTGQRKPTDKDNRPVTDFNKPLLLVCAENECSEEPNKFWQLRELMEKLLVDYQCNPNIWDFYNE